MGSWSYNPTYRDYNPIYSWWGIILSAQWFRTIAMWEVWSTIAMKTRCWEKISAGYLFQASFKSGRSHLNYTPPPLGASKLPTQRFICPTSRQKIGIPITRGTHSRKRYITCLKWTTATWIFWKWLSKPAWPNRLLLWTQDPRNFMNLHRRKPSRSDKWNVHFAACQTQRPKWSNSSRCNWLHIFLWVPLIYVSLPWSYASSSDFGLPVTTRWTALRAPSTLGTLAELFPEPTIWWSLWPSQGVFPCTSEKLVIRTATISAGQSSFSALSGRPMNFLKMMVSRRNLVQGLIWGLSILTKDQRFYHWNRGKKHFGGISVLYHHSL